jgi:hypothetical protein
MEMGATSSRPEPVMDTDGVPIRLSPEQSLTLYPMLKAKSTLTWRDVKANRHMTFAYLTECGIEPSRLHSMQPNLQVCVYRPGCASQYIVFNFCVAKKQAWIECKRAKLADCDQMAKWKPNPLLHFRSSIMHLIDQREAVPPEVLIRARLTVSELRDRYDMNADAMAMLRYDLSHWLQLGLTAQDLHLLNDKQFARVFGATASRDDILRRIAIANVVADT